MLTESSCGLPLISPGHTVAGFEGFLVEGWPDRVLA